MAKHADLSVPTDSMNYPNRGLELWEDLEDWEREVMSWNILTAKHAHS